MMLRKNFMMLRKNFKFLRSLCAQIWALVDLSDFSVLRKERAVWNGVLVARHQRAVVTPTPFPFPGTT